MKNGRRVYDVDTRINPGVEVRGAGDLGEASALVSHRGQAA